jgi:hypothetical protein
LFIPFVADRSCVGCWSTPARGAARTDQPLRELYEQNQKLRCIVADQSFELNRQDQDQSNAPEELL